MHSILMFVLSAVCPRMLVVANSAQGTQDQIVKQHYLPLCPHRNGNINSTFLLKFPCCTDCQVGLQVVCTPRVPTNLQSGSASFPAPIPLVYQMLIGCSHLRSSENIPHTERTEDNQNNSHPNLKLLSNTTCTRGPSVHHVTAEA